MPTSIESKHHVYGKREQQSDHVIMIFPPFFTFAACRVSLLTWEGLFCVRQQCENLFEVFSIDLLTYDILCVRKCEADTAQTVQTEKHSRVEGGQGVEGVREAGEKGKNYPTLRNISHSNPPPPHPPTVDTCFLESPLSQTDTFPLHCLLVFRQLLIQIKVSVVAKKRSK